MARTVKRGRDNRGRITHDGTTRSYFAREAKAARKATNRANRHATDLALRTASDPDTIITDRPPSTGGWVTH